MADQLTDPACCECGGPLTIVDREASLLTVVCAECGASHGVELVTAADGTPVFWPSFRVSVSNPLVSSRDLKTNHNPLSSMKGVTL